MSMGFATDSVSEIAHLCYLVLFMCMLGHNALVCNAAIGAGYTKQCLLQSVSNSGVG